MLAGLSFINSSRNIGPLMAIFICILGSVSSLFPLQAGLQPLGNSPPQKLWSSCCWQIAFPSGYYSQRSLVGFCKEEDTERRFLQMRRNSSRGLWSPKQQVPAAGPLGMRAMLPWALGSSWAPTTGASPCTVDLVPSNHFVGLDDTGSAKTVLGWRLEAPLLFL